MSEGSRTQRFSYANGTNAQYIDALYRQYVDDPSSVEETWRKFFEGYEFASAFERPVVTSGAPEAKVEAFVNAYRRLGHLSAHLNPLEPRPPIREDMLPEAHGLAGVDPDEEFTPVNLPFDGPVPFRVIQQLLLDTYCDKIGADFRDINSIEAVVWFQNEMESTRNRPTLSRETKLRILDKLTQAEGFEKFLQDRYLGQKRFSVEGLDAMIPLLDILADEASQHDVEEICMGMAHRGRLNVLANFMGKPYELMLKEFEGSEYISFDIDGDVKYHMGFASRIKTMSGNNIRLYLSPNPSHLEAVDPVLEGFTRARQRLENDHGRNRILPVLIHGDASFVGQGLVTETLNLAGLKAYSTGGTIHIIANNQVGFTTDPEESRSTTYASDIAKFLRAPILHVNADDPEAVVWTAKLAMAYRLRYESDVVIDLVGYRRHGHNETDEPSFTQPGMYKTIKAHPTVLKLYAERLTQEGVVKADEAEAKMREFRAKLQDCMERVRSGNYEVKLNVPEQLAGAFRHVKATIEDMFAPVKTAVPDKTIKLIAERITTTPSTFHVHPKVQKLYAGRAEMVQGAGAIDWGMAELLAYSSIALDGHHVRLSGQDAQRGTFSHRHAVIRDYETGETLDMLNHIDAKQARVDVINSPLSEQGCMGFEFGYSVADREALVLWEAQFGDFVNGAQIIIDQFLAASEAKWKQPSGLVLLLPHGYEGQGPEHSSARPERFLQLCGNLNLQVANLTTPAQLFHILRRQTLRSFNKPLIILSPKSLLRHPKVVSKLKDFSAGSFSEVIDDPTVSKPDKVERIIFCTGKIFYDLDQAREENKKATEHVAIVRIEQLYPWPEGGVNAIFERYKNAKQVLWVQEEPLNMGYWSFLRHRLKKRAKPTCEFSYCGRKSAGTTAEGSIKAHQKEQERIVHDALGLSVPAKK